jgi:hypothetical protein
MKNKISFSFIILTLIIACQKRPEKIPDQVLNQKEMTSLLMDLHLAQSALSAMPTSDTITQPQSTFSPPKKYSMDDYVLYILKQHNIDTSVFKKSLKFYGERPELLEEVYDSVITNLNRIQSEYEK